MTAHVHAGRIDSLEHDERDDARTALVDARTCGVCGVHRDDVMMGECDSCWAAGDAAAERRADQ